MAEMWVDSTPQPCPRCSRSTVLATLQWRRQWVHVGTWRPECERAPAPLAHSVAFAGIHR
ncbi:hypothetical protein [Amycolatopsis vancoresmycina]|uniref:hypothetical protein n=1 Tax=Amycolatopsis vancoresmycina TaxID=208444 RepID=UPI00039C7CFE|nr:hypothetical protein [Amycolatopsis vancoresmycina]